MTLYENITRRRSVRSYDMTVLDDTALTAIREFIDNSVQMPGQYSRFEIVTGDKVKNEIAPYYILAYCDGSDCSYMNVGYMMQKTDLFLQSKGYGSLWLGMAKPNESDKDFCIMLAFGQTNVPMRQSIREFKRLPIGEISDIDNAVSQAARLAPSAMNSQPWKLEFKESKVTIRYFGRGFSRLVLKKKLSKIDLGIATCHIELALINEGKLIKSITPISNGKDLLVEIAYQ